MTHYPLTNPQSLPIPRDQIYFTRAFDLVSDFIAARDSYIDSPNDEARERYFQLSEEIQALVEDGYKYRRIMQ